jgi:hypothetical protein
MNATPRDEWGTLTPNATLDLDFDGDGPQEWTKRLPGQGDYREFADEELGKTLEGAKSFAKGAGVVLLAVGLWARSKM